MESPVCHAFKEIGYRFGGFDLGMIPIGCIRFFVMFRHLVAFQGVPARVSSVIDGQYNLKTEQLPSACLGVLLFSVRMK